jgi:hypothetical protein
MGKTCYDPYGEETLFSTNKYEPPTSEEQLCMKKYLCSKKSATIYIGNI